MVERIPTVLACRARWCVQRDAGAPDQADVCQACSPYPMGFLDLPPAARETMTAEFAAVDLARIRARQALH